MKYQVQITRVVPEGECTVLAFFNLIINGEFVATGLRLTKDRRNGKMNIAMPGIYSEEHKKYLETCHPINTQCRQEILDLAVSAYTTKIHNKNKE